MEKMPNAIVKEILDKQDIGNENGRQDCIARFGQTCLENINQPVFNKKLNSLVCPAYWDGFLCWSDALPGTELIQACPSHVAGFISGQFATRQCMENGSWFIHDETKKSWTNYSNCYDKSMYATILIDLNKTNESTEYEKYIPAIKIMYETGYIVSFVTLLIAFIIMLSIRKLHCARNILHMHLFASFMFRAFITLIIAFTFKNGLGLPSDMRWENGSLYYSINTETNNWHCKLMTSISKYFQTANYSWILMEGLYLHNLIFRALFVNSSNSIKWYVIMGWGMPLAIIVMWIVARLMLEDAYCWTKNDDNIAFLIVSVPVFVSILINFVLFMRISLVLYKKLRSPINEDSRRYQKWVKSTLVLVPLFGVHSVFSLALYSSIKTNKIVELVWMFFDLLFNSFQGFFVAILYCFLNGEVKAELKPHFYCFLTFLATNQCFKYCFPYRQKFLRSVVVRNSVCTTMSCSSLYTNGVFHRNSKTRLDSIPKLRQFDKSSANHINGKSLQDIPRRNSKSHQRNSAPVNCETTFSIEQRHGQLESAKMINEETLCMIRQNLQEE